MTAPPPGDEFRVRLAVELEAWQREQIISAEQAGRILARYELRGSAARAVRLGPVATFLSILGAIVLGTGVVYFFAANWDALPDWFKVALVFGATAIAYASGYWLQFRWGGLPRAGAGLILLGALLFQAGIFLLEQIYNMPVDSPLALLLGAAGILPLAYAVGSRFVLVLGLLDGLAWLVWTLIDRYPDSPERFAVPLMLILAGVVLYGVGHLHDRRDDGPRFTPVYQVLGLLTVLLPAYVLSFGWLWDNLADDNLSSLNVPLWFAGALLLALAAAAVLALGRGGRQPSPAEAGAFALVVVITGVVAYLPQWAAGYALLFNAVFFGLAVLAIAHGYLEGEARYINTGIPLLALGLITRYFDTFWDLLPRSAFYIAGGIVLLALAAGLERLRQRLLTAIDGQADRPLEGV